MSHLYRGNHYMIWGSPLYKWDAGPKPAGGSIFLNKNSKKKTKKTQACRSHSVKKKKKKKEVYLNTCIHQT